MEDLLIRALEASPLGIAGLSLLLSIMIFKRQRGNSSELVGLRENHLHDIKESLSRIEKCLNEGQDKQSALLYDIKSGVEVINTKLNRKR